MTIKFSLPPTVGYLGLVLSLSGTAGRAEELLKTRPPLQASAIHKLPVGHVQARGWLGRTGESWERGPYSIRGAVTLAYVTRDPGKLAKIKPWLDWTLNNQKENGFFGPESNKDWCPRRFLLQALITHYEATQDARVIHFMQRFFEYRKKTLEKQPLSGWTKARGGENLLCLHWLNNQTGDRSLLLLGVSGEPIRGILS